MCVCERERERRRGREGGGYLFCFNHRQFSSFWDETSLAKCSCLVLKYCVGKAIMGNFGSDRWRLFWLVLEECVCVCVCVCERERERERDTCVVLGRCSLSLFRERGWGR